MPDYSVPVISVEATRDTTKVAADAIRYRRLSTSAVKNEPLGDIANSATGINTLLNDIAATFSSDIVNDPLTNVKIGITTLDVPPTQINIVEDKYNDEIPVLRGRGAALIKSGRGHIRITMPIDFPDAESINGSLRELVAQFRVCPFTTLENYRVASVVAAGRVDKLSTAAAQEIVNKAKDDKEMALEAYSKARQRVMDRVLPTLASYQEIVGYDKFRSVFGHTYQDLLPVLAGYDGSAFRDWCLGPFVSIIQGDLGGTFKYARDMRLDGVVRRCLLNTHLEDVVGPMIEAYNTFLSKVREFAEASLAQSLTAPVVPIAFRQLMCQTVPGSVDRLQAHLELWYFNTQAYVPALQFVGNNGAPTLDVGNCQIYRDHVNRYLSSAGIRSYNDYVAITPLGEYVGGSNLLMLEYPTTETKAVPNSKEQPSIVRGVKNKNADSGVKEEVATKVLLLSNDENIMVKGIAVSLENNLAPQPIEGSLYGTLQYMGTMNAKIKITIGLHGSSEEDVVELMAKVQDVKNQTDAVAQYMGQKARRTTRIRIENALVNMFGVQNVLLDRVETRTAGPFAAEVDMYFTEYTTNVEKRERVLYASDNSQKMYSEVLWYIANVVTAYYYGEGTKEALDFVNNNRSAALDAVQWARNLLYDATTGIITPDVMTAALTNSKLYQDIGTIFNKERNKIVTSAVSAHEKKQLALLRDWRHDGEKNKAQHLRFGLENTDPKIYSAGDAWLPLDTSKIEPDITDQQDRAFRDLADKYITSWAGLYPKQQLDWTAFGTLVSGMFGTVVIPKKPDKGLIENIVRELFRQGRLQQQLSTLKRSVYEARTIFSGLNSLVQSYRDEQTGSVYPDLQLPDYFTAFKHIWGFIKDKLSIDVTTYDSLNDLPQKAKAVINFFVPTYFDLGLTPPWGKKPQDFARTLSDPVEPDFYFFWEKVKSKDGFQAGLKQARREIAGAPTIRRDDQTAPDNGFGRWKTLIAGATIPGRQVMSNKVAADPSLVESLPSKSPTVVCSASGDTHMVPTTAVGDEYQYVSADKDVAASLARINPMDAKHRECLLKNVYNEIQDRYRRMLLAFPAFKVSLIETDGEAFGYYDDWYGYNSIKSIHILNHKITPKIAEIEIVNVTGTLDEATSIVSDQDREAYEKSLMSGTKERGTGENTDINHFFLESGTPIVIKLGYSPIESELATRFEGQVVSLTTGDVIKLVAQGYAAELTKPINTVVEGRNFAYITRKIMEESGTPHYGDISYVYNEERGNLVENSATGERSVTPSDTVNLSVPGSLETDALSDRLTGSLRGISKSALATQHMMETAVGAILADRKTYNVYLPQEYHLSGLLSAGSGDKWGIPNIDGISALNEITRYLPGFVCATRSYGRNGVTLFIGKPEQPYFYTDMKRDEETSWLKVKHQAEIDARVKADELFAQFLKSRWGDMLQGLISGRRGATAGGTLNRVSTRMLQELAASGVTTLRVLSLGTFRQVERLGGYLLGYDGGDLSGYLKSFIYTPGEDWHQQYSPSRTNELSAIRDKIHDDGVRIISSLFFAKYNDLNTWNGMAVDPWVKAGLRVLDNGWNYIQEGIFSPVVFAYDVDAPSFKPNAGVMMYWYGGAAHALDVISAQIGSVSGDDVPEDIMDNIVSDAFPELNHKEQVVPMREHKTNIAHEFFTSNAKSVINWIPEWKIFLFCFDAFLQSDASPELVESIYAANKRVEELQLNPRMRRFRRHHFVSSYADVVKNNIQATREFMANHVLVSYPEGVSMKQQGDKFVAYVGSGQEKSLLVGYNDDIDPGEHVVRVVNEHNATSAWAAKICARSNLAEALRPMYRGEIILRGNERIEPYDIVWVDDKYNGISGPIEAETVIDHLDETGYNVTVVPHAVVLNNSSSGWADITSIGSLWHEAFMSAITLNLHGVLMDWRLQYRTGKSYRQHINNKLIAYIVGQSAYNGVDQGVRIVPLVRNGKPWTAGLRSAGPGGWVARAKKRLNDVRQGLNAVQQDKNIGPYLEWVPLHAALDQIEAGLDYGASER